MEIKITLPLTDEILHNLKMGDKVLLSGTIYTARDAAHKRFLEDNKNEVKLPFNPKNQIIYYVGPSPTKPGDVIGSSGPTTSYRMDSFACEFMQMGLKGMIGKGPRNSEVKECIKKFGAVYFVAIGGAAVVISESIVKSEIIAYEDLQTEAVRKLEVKDFPCYVAIDTDGNDIFDR